MTLSFFYGFITNMYMHFEQKETYQFKNIYLLLVWAVWVKSQLIINTGIKSCKTYLGRYLLPLPEFYLNRYLSFVDNKRMEYSKGIPIMEEKHSGLI